MSEPLSTPNIQAALFGLQMRLAETPPSYTHVLVAESERPIYQYLSAFQVQVMPSPLVAVGTVICMNGDRVVAVFNPARTEI